MLARLAKLAARSQQLRKIAMQKQAIIGALAGRAAVSAGKWAAKNPGQAAVGGLAAGLTAAAAPGAVKGTYQEHMAGFRPDVQQAAQAPVPPGAR